MLLATHFLTEKIYLGALAKGVRTFLYNEADFVLPQTEGITFFNCTTQRVSSTWFSWEKNEKLLLAFKKKFPQFFQWNNYDITLAFQKALYWSNHKTGYLNYTRECFFPTEKLYRESPLHPVTTWKVWLKYFVRNVYSRKNTTRQYKQKQSQNIGIFIESEFQISLYKNILSEAGKNTRFFVFVNDATLIEPVKDCGIDLKNIHICLNNFSRKIPFANIFTMNKGDLYILNQLLIHWQEMEYWAGIAESITKENIGKLLINEGENGVLGAVVSEIMSKNGITTYNTMNGSKAGEVQDSFVNFNYWFVWDQQMKKLLIEKNNLNPQMLLVSGHLMEDEAKEHIYQNSLNLDASFLFGKKIISVFSVRGKREEKMQAFEYLYNLADKNPNIFLLVRPHPSEKESEGAYPFVQLKNVKWIDYSEVNSKTTLFDQLSISILSICFGSTVALESRFFGVPCITVEKRKESLIYAEDGNMIIKVNELNDSLLCNLLGNNKQKPVTQNANVAEFITSVLLN